MKNQLNDKTKSQIKMPKIFQMLYQLCQMEINLAGIGFHYISLVRYEVDIL